MDYKQIVYRPGRIDRIMMKRPEYRNALSRVMLSDEAKDFCAGHDIGSPPDQNFEGG